MQANMTWDLASSGEVLPEKKSQLASVSKSMLTAGLATCSDLRWSGESWAWEGCGQGLGLGTEKATKQNCSIWRCPWEHLRQRGKERVS